MFKSILASSRRASVLVLIASVAFGIFIANGSSTAVADHKPIAADTAKWDVVFTDDFEGRTDLGEKFVGTEGENSGWKITDGVLVARQVRSDHGTVLRRMRKFSDMMFEFDFRFADKKSFDRFNVVFDDSNDRSVHAGHISRVSVSRKAVALKDDKTGSMNLEVRKLRKIKDPSGEQKKELERRLKGTTSQKPVNLSDTSWHKMKITIQGSKMSVMLDGKKLGTLDSPGILHPTRNKYGFTVAGKGTVEFDNWKVSIPQKQKAP